MYCTQKKKKVRKITKAQKETKKKRGAKATGKLVVDRYSELAIRVGHTLE